VSDQRIPEGAVSSIVFEGLADAKVIGWTAENPELALALVILQEMDVDELSQERREAREDVLIHLDDAREAIKRGYARRNLELIESGLELQALVAGMAYIVTGANRE
jgi:hypothetical protein